MMIFECVLCRFCRFLKDDFILSILSGARSCNEGSSSLTFSYSVTRSEHRVDLKSASNLDRTQNMRRLQPLRFLVEDRRRKHRIVRLTEEGKGRTQTNDGVL